MSRPYFSRFVSDITASSSAAFTSLSVHVGDLNKRVSDTIALSISPAIFFSGVSPASLYSSKTSVDVHPTISILTFNGSSV